LLFQLDAEHAHEWTLALLARLPVPDVEMPAWPVRVLGTTWRNPMCLAAGMDKDAVALPAWRSLGFGAVEVGTVTPRPQPGNPRPRLFRLAEDSALINRMGFNSAGMAVVRDNLLRGRERPGPYLAVGVNVGKNKATPLDRAADDYTAAIRHLRDAADWLTVNVSSPNTPGLRVLQQGDWLGGLVRACVGEAGGVPVLVKIAPDLDDGEVVDTVRVALDAGAAGIVATNTTTARPAGLRSGYAAEAGGLSGRPLAGRARQVLAQVLRAGPGTAVLAAGGIARADDVADRLAVGAAAAQVFTGFVYGGPGWVAQVVHRLCETREGACLSDC
jgi:dihydroorotate dehydrogenase